jgi:hypothetical protein
VHRVKVYLNSPLREILKRKTYSCYLFEYLYERKLLHDKRILLAAGSHTRTLAYACRMRHMRMLTYIALIMTLVPALCMHAKASVHRYITWI